MFTDQAAREAVWSAMDHWMAHTCIKFVPVEPDDQDYIEFVEMNGYVRACVLYYYSLGMRLPSHTFNIGCTLVTRLYSSCFFSVQH